MLSNGFKTGLTLVVSFACVASSLRAIAEQVLLPSIHERLGAGASVKIVCFGDSVTGVYYHSGGRRAYPEMLETALNKLFPAATVHVINAGVSGHSTADGIARLKGGVLKHRPDLVTVMFGLNDMVRVPLDQFRGNLRKITAQIRSSGSEVLVCTPNDIEDSVIRRRAILREYVGAIREFCRSEQVPLVDVFAAFESLRTEDRVGFRMQMSDEIHPNMDGHKRIAAVIAKSISGRVVSVAAEPPLSPAIPHTLAKLAKRERIEVLATPPYDSIIGSILRKLHPEAEVHVTVWQTHGKSLDELVKDAEQVRTMQPDLVIHAFPSMALTASDDDFCRAFTLLLGKCLSEGVREWDVLVFPPSLERRKQTAEQTKLDILVQRMIHANDLPLLARRPNDDRPAADMITEWLLSETNTKAVSK